MVITVLGAAGKTGQEVVSQALAAGHRVHALVRRPDGIAPKSNLKVFVGDATNAKDIEEVSHGTDVIISALGTSTGKSSLMTDAVIAIIKAAQETGVTRFILISSYSVGGAGQLSIGAKIMTRTVLKNIAADKARSEAILKESNLDWTIVDPTILTNGRKGSGARELPQTEKIGLLHTITRADLAAWMLKEAVENKHSRDEVIISK
jgi:uncharacterized protein YbjT (DUF2867 family)